VQQGRTFITQGDAIFLAKDFTTVLSMRRERRAAILGQLREIHDGEFTRTFGTGETKVWRGRVTVVAAVTPALDRHYSIFSTLGERFLQIRWHRPDSEEAGQWAIDQQGKEEELRQEIRDAVHGVFDLAAKVPPLLPTAMKERLAALSEIVAIARTHVYRNSYGSREIEYVPEPEANTRIAKGLAGIAKGVAALNGRGEVAEEDLQDAMRVGLDSIPEYRRALLVGFAQGHELDAIAIPRTLRDRELENLAELGLLEDAEANCTSGTYVSAGWKLTQNAGRLFKKSQVCFK
jgi:hypothetical protein